MTAHPTSPAALPGSSASGDGALRRFLLYAFLALALLYAFLAGLRTVSELDLGWQMATARWILAHHSIPSTDVLSSTARGNPWIYPPFAGMLFLALFRLGGYAALSWLTAAAGVATVAVLLRRPSIPAALLAALAVPGLAFRTAPRAEMFTTVLFAAFLVLLWRHFRGERVALWLLPVLMFAWVNLHLGFVAGLALIAAYLVLELLELPFSARRRGALTRLQLAAPWLFASFAATVLNPWGPRIYSAIARQNAILKLHVDVIGEWAQPPLSAAGLRTALHWRDPESGYWWLLAAALLAILAALWRRQLGAALVLAVAAAASLQYLRVQGLFSAVVVVIGGAMLGEFARRDPASPPPPRRARPSLASPALFAATAVLLLLGLLLGFRASDLVSNRFYIGQTSLFGAGESWWFPERAAAFVESRRLPPNLFNTYNLGGFLTWRLPDYPDYIDGRAVPFGGQLFLHARALLAQSPDSAAWEQEAGSRGVNLVFLPISRYLGLGSVPLRAWCASAAWQVVYIDEVSAVFLRRTPANLARLASPPLPGGCLSLSTRSPADFGITAGSSPGRTFNFYVNRGSILYVLGDDRQALADLTLAAGLFPDDANVHMILGQVHQAEGSLAGAEREYRLAVRLRPSDIAWYLLGVLLAEQRRYPEAAAAIRNSAGLSYQESFDRYRLLGRICLAMSDPHGALDAFDQAERREPAEVRSSGNEFNAQLAEARARAWAQLGDLSRALQYQLQALQFTPDNPARWNDLAAIYDAMGDAPKAADARRRAATLAQR